MSKKPFKLFVNFHNPNDNTTQPQHCNCVGHEKDCANPTTTPPHKLNVEHQESQIKNKIGPHDPYWLICFQKVLTGKKPPFKTNMVPFPSSSPLQ